MRVGLIPCTRPFLVGDAMATLEDCDRVLVAYDRARVGEARTRNALIDAVDEECEVRFLDDDDFALPIEPTIPLGADVLAFGFMVNGVTVRPPTDPLAAAVNSIVNGNWIVRRGALEFVRARFGAIYEPAWPGNTATRIWLRMIDCGLRFAFAPELIGYVWRRGFVPGSPSSKPKNDPALYHELLERGARHVESRIVWDQGGINA